MTAAPSLDESWAQVQLRFDDAGDQRGGVERHGVEVDRLGSMLEGEIGPVARGLLPARSPADARLAIMYHS